MSFTVRVEKYFVVFHDMYTKIMNPELSVVKYFLDRNVWDRKVLYIKECYCNNIFFLLADFCLLFCFQEVLFVPSYTNDNSASKTRFPLHSGCSLKFLF